MDEQQRIRLEELLKKYENKQLSEEEVLAFHELLQLGGAKDLFASFTIRAENENASNTFNDNPDWKKLWLDVQIKSGLKKRSRLLYYYKWAGVAAVFFLFIAVSAVIYNKKPSNNTASKIAANNMVDMAPGHNGAILTLGDGSHIVIDSLNNGNIAKQGAVNVVKKNGALIYQASQQTAQKTTVFNTMTTPRGRQFQLVLPDGTRVWLNASSSITYPTAFSGKERKVSISGEAYFEVVHNRAMPFKVEVGGQIVEDLGTHFNIMAYPDEKMIATTLVEGSIKLINGHVNRILKPGQQARLDKLSGIIALKDIDTSQIIAWVHGQIVLDNTSIAELMRQISRWYNVDVQINGDFTKRQFGGTIDRNVNLSYVLDALKANGIDAKLQDNKVIVSPE
ncbi:FecR family protein [Arachidicoccus sp.]|uniref:FecR family protein n=1 Tax=Arachidicoccus sp. TaxID=1872624 RepID=UPI003D1A11E7